MKNLTGTLHFVCRQCSAHVSTTLDKLSDADRKGLCASCDA
jgi:hypothetical protein